MSNKKLFLLDGHALVYRAYFSYISRPLINSKGLNTSAVHGFVRTLWDLLHTQKPTHIAVSFDLPGATFRHQMYEPYKANREAQPEPITIALPYIMQLIEAFNIPVVVKEGFEADDVIGTLAKQAEKEGFTVYMVTPDKDYAQLVSDNIFIYKPSRSGNGIEILGVEAILAEWQIKRIDQVIDILGLEGDKVDNIPGIPGIGEKTAIALIEKYGSIEGLIQNVHQLKGKQQENVRNYTEQARLSRILATIDTNVPIQFDAKRYELEPYNRPLLEEIFKELEFRNLAKDILGSEMPIAPSVVQNQQMDLFGNIEENNSKKIEDSQKSAPPTTETENYAIADKNAANTPHQYHLVQTPTERQYLIDLLKKQSNFAFDTETTDLDPNIATLVGISFAFASHEAYYVPIPENQAEARKIAQEFKQIFENEAIIKIGQNVKYDIIMLKQYDVEVHGKFVDTMLAHYLLEPDLRHNLNYLSETYLNYAPIPIENLIGGKGKKQGSMRDVDLEKICEYAAEDADIAFQLGKILMQKLQENNLENLYKKLEEPLINVLANLEFEGIRINSDFLKAYSIDLQQKLEQIEQKIYQQAGSNFNIHSPKQVGEILFDKLKIPYRWRKTKTGQYSTDEEIMTELAENNAIVADILRHRGVAKLKSTYVDALPKMVNPHTGRVHSSFNQALAATGRLSSNNPNLQNIPIRTPEGSTVRKAFIPKNDEFLLLSADYSQIELRLIAEISGDEAMLEAFQSGYDIHRATAAKVYDMPIDLVTPEQRRNAKTVNFSIIYGAGASNLSQQLGISRTDSKILIEQYFKQYHGLKSYMEKTVDFARKNGYVMTLLGRRRYLTDINSRNAMIRSQAERIAINTPIQGTAADMIKLAMINIYNYLKNNNLKTKMILQVHDELVFDAHKSEIESLKPMIIEKMSTAIPNLRVPIEVGLGVGENWLEAH